jgi:pimeloyl-ACP methyl ester carboxylesterase
VTGPIPVVLVHGNPETAAVWDPLVAVLHERGVTEVVRLSPPGFGAPVPVGWGATVVEYRQWLADALDALGRPVHLVGHDWGGVHSLGVAMTRPDPPATSGAVAMAQVGRAQVAAWGQAGSGAPPVSPPGSSGVTSIGASRRAPDADGTRLTSAEECHPISFERRPAYRLELGAVVPVTMAPDA